MSDEANHDPKSMKAGPTQATLLMAVGGAISTWTTAESMLVRICARLLGSSKEKTGVVLYSIINFYVWLGVIDELFEMSPNFKPLKKEWAKISSALKRLNDTRVRLAHHTALPHPDDKELPVGLRPPLFDHRSKSAKYEPLELEEILNFSEGVLREVDKLRKLYQAMKPLREAPSE